MISYGEVELFKMQGDREAHAMLGKNQATVSELLPCTNYTFVVAAVSLTGKVGPGAQRSAATLEMEGENRDQTAR